MVQSDTAINPASNQSPSGIAHPTFSDPADLFSVPVAHLRRPVVRLSLDVAAQAAPLRDALRNTLNGLRCSDRALVWCADLSICRRD